MTIGNVSIQTAGGATTLGVIPTSGYGFSFLNVLYRYANLTLPYNPDDPGLSYTYNNSSLSPVVILYARFFNLLNESSVATLSNVGTSAFQVSGAPSTTCLDVRNFGAKGDGVTDDTAAIQAALDQAASNYLGNQASIGLTAPVTPHMVQSVAGNIANGSGTSVTLPLTLPTTAGNEILVGFCAFNYNGAPTITDNQGNTPYTQVYTANNGEFVLYLYQVKVATAGATIITLNVAGKNFNSFISAIACEMSGIVTPINADRTVSAIYGTSFVPATMPPTAFAECAFTLAVNSAAAGQVPPTPPGFSLIGAQPCPQPNGLNGAVPVTVMAFNQWTGVAPLSPKWGGSTWNGVTISVALRLQTVALPVSKGLTTVCIPAGVNCMVSPVALDERNFGGNSCRYGTAAYSLLIQDGVTLEIDGQLIANPAATETGLISPVNNTVGWFLVMNKNWLSNSTIFTPFASTAGVFAGLDGGGQGGAQNYLAGPGTQQLTATVSPFATSTAGTVLWMSIAQSTATPPIPTIPSGFSVLPGGSGPPAMIASGNFAAGQPFNLSQTFTFGHDGSCVCLAAAFKALSVVTLPSYTFLASQSGGDHGTLSSSVAIPPGSMILCVWFNQGNSQATTYNLGAVSDSNGNQYTNLGTPTEQGFDSSSLLHFGCMCSMAVCFNPKVTTGGSVSYSWATTPLGIGGGTVSFYLVTGLGACGTPISWPNYLAGTAVNEGARNKDIRITGNGRVILNGDHQVAVLPTGLGQLFPTALARFVACDNSSIDSLEIVNPFGCAIQWLNSTGVTISGLFVHDAASSPAGFGIQNPGIIEIDMMRASTVKNCLIQNCSVSRGILDWASYQMTISGNTLIADYTGYEYRDMGGEWGYFFAGAAPANVVTQNSEISQNKATNCSTDPASAGFAGAMAGSNGFLFLGGFFAQTPRSTVTGIRFHDNVGGGNSTDFSADTYVSFLSNVNNSFGGGVVSSGQNPVTGEVPTGTIDGTNVTFTLAHIPIASTLQVFLNGLFETFGTDYTLNGKIITFAVAPAAGGKIQVNYSYLSGN